MTRLTVTAKGQVTLKQELLKHLGVSSGEKVEADKMPNGRLIVRAATREGSIAEFIGCLATKREPRLTIDQIKKITTQAWSRKQ